MKARIREKVGKITENIKQWEVLSRWNQRKVVTIKKGNKGKIMKG